MQYTFNPTQKEAASRYQSGGPLRPGKESMVPNFEQFQKIGKDNAEATAASFGAVSKGFQKIAVELADYSKKVFDEGTAAAEKLLGVKSLDKAIEVHSDYVKTAYEGFVSESTKLGELYAGWAQEVYKPFETVVAKATTVEK